MTMLGFVKTDGRGGRLPRWLTIALAAAALPVAACSLDVTDPDIITPDNLQGASALPTIRAAAIGDFALSDSGSGADGSQGTEGITMMSGLLGDEWVNSETFPTRIEIDRRSILCTDYMRYSCGLMFLSPILISDHQVKRAAMTGKVE